MKPICRICKNGACGISITGLSQDDHQYSDVLIDDYGVYRYEDTVTINFMTPVDSKEVEGDFTYSIVEHTGEDLVVMKFVQDGLFKITHMILPTMKWVEEMLAAGFDITSIYDYIYIYDNEKVYKLIEGVFEEVDFEEPYALNSNVSSTIFTEQQYTFCTCRLQLCFYNRAQDFLSTLCDRCASNEDVKNRDIIWMSIYIINYLLDLGRYFEALKVIEKIESCTGLCSQVSTSNNSISNGCGCSR